MKRIDNQALQLKSFKLKEQSRKIQERINKIKHERSLLNEQLRSNLVNKLEKAKKKRLSHLLKLRSKAHRSSGAVHKNAHRSSVRKKIGLVLLKLKVNQLKKTTLESLEYSYLVKNHSHTYFTLQESILSLLGFQNPKVFTYTYFLVSDLRDSISQNLHSGLNANHDDKTTNTRINQLTLLLYKTSLQLHHDFESLIYNNSVLEMTDLYNPDRIKFSRTYFFFTGYIEIFKYIHFLNFVCILHEALDIVKQQLEIFTDRALMQHKKFLEDQLALSASIPKQDSINMERLFKELSYVSNTGGFVYVRFDPEIHDTGNMLSCTIKHSIYTILTPPGILLLAWRLYYFRKFRDHKASLKLRTGIRMIADDLPGTSVSEDLGLLDLTNSIHLSVERVNDFLINLRAISGNYYQPIETLSDLSELKLSLLDLDLFGSLDSKSEFDTYEECLLREWVRKYGLSFRKFQVFENLLPFLNFDKYSTELGTKSPSLRFPKFYKFLISNGFRFKLSNSNLCSFSEIDLTSSPQATILEFYRSTCLSALLKGTIEEDEVNSLIIEDLRDIQYRICNLLKSTLHHYLKIAYASVAKNHQEFSVYLLHHNNPKSRVYGVIVSRFMGFMLHDFDASLFGSKKEELERIKIGFYLLIEYWYSIYSPMLNWIYRDLGL